MFAFRSALCLLIATAGHASAQAQLDWMAAHDGRPGGLFDFAQRCAVDSTGAVYVLTQSSNPQSVPPSADSSDVELVKYSPTGVESWSRRFDSKAAPGDLPMDLAIAPDGQIGVCGFSFNGTSDLFVMRYDSNGNLLWSTVWQASPGTGDDRAYALAFDALSNLVLAGTATDPQGKIDMLVQAWSPAGALLWDTRIDGADHNVDVAKGILIDAAGDIFIAGSVDGTQFGSGCGVARLTPAGALVWLRTIAMSAAGGESEFSRLVSDGQGGVVVSGLKSQPLGLSTVPGPFVARYAANGTKLWQREYLGGNTFASRDLELDAGGTIWALYRIEFGPPRIFLQRYDLAGSVLSTFTYDGPTHQGALPGDLVLGSAGQVFLTGSNYVAPKDVLLFQLDGSGAQTWLRNWSATSGEAAVVHAAAAPSSRIALCGATPATTSYDAFTMQVDVSDSVQGYCTAKVNSLGCTPRAWFTGISSSAMNAGFTLRVSNVRNNKSGLFLYGVSGAASAPFQGGTLCVQTPIRRTIVVSSGGSAAPAIDCSGVFALDMNAFAKGALGGTPLAALATPGTTVHAQAWGRDPGFPSPNDTMLSSGLRYVVLP